ncbi:MAG: glucosaminidase domain-containing protein [Alistipes sp.]|nr:glucosaminidase domain-containing protein [Alistipes sp.]
MNFIGKTTFSTLIISILLILTFSEVSAQVNEPSADKAKKSLDGWVRMTREEYIMKWRHLAIENMEVYGIPASITMGQAILESGFGNGYLARVANNHFCIKCKSTWQGEKVYHDDDAAGECFRAYPTVADSFRDHAEFLNNGQRYDFLFSYDVTDYKSWAKGLKTAGYATAKDYDARLIRVIEESQLYLLDKKNGLKLYDDYMAKKLGIDKESLSEKYAPATETAPKEGVTEQSAATDTANTTRYKMPADRSLAYADEGVDPDNYRVTINSHRGYNVYLTNGAHYIVARAGDSFEKLAELFEMSASTLRKFNDVKGGDTQPLAGDVVYVERKAAAWNGEQTQHTVQQGETLYYLSQLYGIRLSQLSKMNRMRASERLQEGQTIRLK